MIFTIKYKSKNIDHFNTDVATTTGLTKNFSGDKV